VSVVSFFRVPSAPHSKTALSRVVAFLPAFYTLPRYTQTAAAARRREERATAAAAALLDYTTQSLSSAGLMLDNSKKIC